MVNRQFFTARLATAILAHKTVAFEHIAATECHNLNRKSIVARERDHFWDFQCQPLCPDDWIAIGRTKVGPVFPAIKLKIGRIDNPGGFVPNFDEGTSDRRDCNGLPVAVQYQSRSFQNRTGHRSHLPFSSLSKKTIKSCQSISEKAQLRQRSIRTPRGACQRHHSFFGFPR